MPKQQKIEKPDPAAALVTSLLSLYVTFPLTVDVSEKEAKNLSPAEALTLSLMGLKKAYKSSQVQMHLHMTYGYMNRSEAQKFVEITLRNLMSSGYVKIANKEAVSLYEEHLNAKVEKWGLPNIPFVITAAGAKRIGWLVGNLLSVQYDDVVKMLQADSKAAAAEWLVEFKRGLAAQKAAEKKQLDEAKKAAAKKSAVSKSAATKKPVAAKKTVAAKPVAVTLIAAKRAAVMKPAPKKTVK
ncbi:hypothetical protein J2S30_002572 [Herbaspirillum rubrisubalbicans]|uniref:hypothetical protein n=1 Tax=Herbaspirillum rubrisubalbicans TaxID=80842 RepID=UPI00209EF436|nr:hypothetical protein [Herbaspirillum rubrisubalbicans]MCP1574193.1 hypothetical protein [Herbaspirillum rubrisubalbicans]